MADDNVCKLTPQWGLWEFSVQPKRPFIIPIPGSVLGVTYVSGYDTPFNRQFGDILDFSADSLRPEEFCLYDENEPRTKLTVAAVEFLLNFATSEGVEVETGIFSDGDDRIFGDLGNDWIVGGTGRDHVYGGYGGDLLNADDVLETNGGLNDAPDGPQPSYADIVFSGAQRDVLIANTAADRLINSVGEFNSYLVPFSAFGKATVTRSLQPQLEQYLYDLSASDGADPTQANDTAGGSDAAAERNGEPESELGLVKQQDPDWRDQTGAPDDPQPGNIPGVARDRRSSRDSS